MGAGGVTSLPPHHRPISQLIRGYFVKDDIHVSVSNLDIPMCGPQTQYSKEGEPIMGLYKLLTDTVQVHDAEIEKLGTRPRTFISGNICFEFSVQCMFMWFVN